MMNEIAKPDSIEGFQEQVRGAGANHKCLALIGSGSKLRLGKNIDSPVVSTSNYAGIVDHQASDFTITVKTGTLMEDVIRLLDSLGQYLPFDPVFVQKRATVGGTIAAGINGPCRLRHGGLRDFLIGCQFIDGQGNVIRSGGKVVKNAAGFDLSKYFVGSAGRFGLILEATFKVFPKPRFSQTAVFSADSLPAALETHNLILALALVLDALEISETNQIFARWSAETETALEDLSRSLHQLGNANYGLLSGERDVRHWQDISNFNSLNADSVVVKVPLAANRILEFDTKLKPLDIKRRFGVQGNVAYLFLPSVELVPSVDSALCQLLLSGQVIVGRPDLFLTGSKPQMPFLQRIKLALDPSGVFQPLGLAFPEVTK